MLAGFVPKSDEPFPVTGQGGKYLGEGEVMSRTINIIGTDSGCLGSMKQLCPPIDQCKVGQEAPKYKILKYLALS